MLDEWLKNALSHAKMSQAGLAKRMTESLRVIDRAAVNKMTKGTRKIAGDELYVISQITGFPPPSPEVSDAVEPLGGVVKVTVKGIVQAGAWNDDGEWEEGAWEEIQIADVPEYRGVQLHACRVRGDSMDKVYPEGTILVWVNVHESQEPIVSGKRYIVRQVRNDGAEYEMTVKTYIANKSGEWLMPESTNPEWQTPIRYSNGTSDAVEIIGRVVRSIREE